VCNFWGLLVKKFSLWLLTLVEAPKSDKNFTKLVSTDASQRGLSDNSLLLCAGAAQRTLCALKVFFVTAFVAKIFGDR
jgi:hypothetical protein